MANSLWVAWPFSAMVSSYDEQDVSDTALLSAASSYDQQMESSLALPFFLQRVSHVIQWPTGTRGEWQCFFLLPCSLIINHSISNSQWVALTFFPISSHPMTNSLWVTLPFSSMQSHHMSINDQQKVSDTNIFCAMSSESHLIPWSTVSEQHFVMM